MAYFSNGTEHMMYDEEYCSKCHFKPEPKDGKDGPFECNIMFVHALYNYDQCEDSDHGRDLKTILNSLIPVDERGYATRCNFFIEKQCHTQEEMF